MELFSILDLWSQNLNFFLKKRKHGCLYDSSRNMKNLLCSLGSGVVKVMDEGETCNKNLVSQRIPQC